ncbi:MAG TPA: hybrid sensor histidine kinase/response regulator [Thermoanaerobaculia bacterium]|nr:hybrid sensor histidine kinase/response regulator [Thermoanaerobaculia bacterium]
MRTANPPAASTGIAQGRSGTRREGRAHPTRRTRHSLRGRFVVAISALVALVLLALAIVLAVTGRRGLRRDLESHAESFALLATAPLCTAYETYYTSGYSKFRELVSDVAGRQPDLVEVAIYDTSGRQLFTSAEFAREVLGPLPVPAAAVVDSRLLLAVRGLAPVSWRDRDAHAEERFVVAVPHVEEWGRHRYSAVYRFGYGTLAAATSGMAKRLLWLTAGSLVMGVLIAMFLARQSLGPLEELTAGAGDLAEGRLDRRIDLATGDEFETLAQAFNHMAARLAASIAELEASNQALQRSNRELEDLDRLKSDLLANVSHELRTPLTSLKGYAEALREELLGPITEAQREALEVSERNLDRLLGMIEELLSYARLESGAAAVDPRAMDLGAMAAQVMDNLRATRGPELELRLSVPPDLPKVWGDAQRISQVLENLLVNAVKFTPAGGRVELRLRPEADQVVVEVADTGIGIPPEERRRIFERFYQVESSSRRRYAGIGLGLAIVRQILDAHGCAIEVDSVVGEGTTFRFRLPWASDVGPQVPRRGGPQVVLIDDDVAFTRPLVSYLEGQGYPVRVANSCAGGEPLVRELRPRLVILDRLLPDGDGFDLLQRWRRQLDRRQLPVVVVSARREARLALRLGANACLSKPVAPSQVQAAIETTLAKIRAPTVLLLPLAGGTGLLETAAEGLRREGFRLRRLGSVRELAAAAAGSRAAALVVDLDGKVDGEVAEWVAEPSRRVAPRLVLLTREVAADVEEWARATGALVAVGPEGAAEVASRLREAVMCSQDPA